MALQHLWKHDWVTTLRKVWAEMLLDDCFGAAAQLAYYFLLAFFPFLILLLVLVGMFPLDAELRTGVDTLLLQIMPEKAWNLVESTVGQVFREVLNGRHGFILYAGMGVALVAASNGFRAVMVTLNRAYSVREGRSVWYRYALSIGLTFCFCITIIVAAFSIYLSNRIGDQVNATWGPQWSTVWIVVNKVVAVAVLIYILELIYHLAPNVRRPWRWISPGSVVGVLLWYAGIKMFGLYVARFSHYEVMYASLGAVVVFLLWLYIAGLAILVGGELNAELERSAGLLAPVAVPAPQSVDAAGHDTSIRDDYRTRPFKRSAP